MLLTLALSLGVIVLAWGLARAGRASGSALCIAAAAVLYAIAGPTASLTMRLIAAAFLLVGLGAMGWMVLAETDDQWEHIPEVHGFRPAAGTGCHRQVARTEGRPSGRPTVASCARRRQR